MFPILLATVVPALFCLTIAFVLRPQAEASVSVEPWKKNHNITYRPTTYLASTWGAKPAPFKYQTQEDPADPNPIYDDFASLIRASEARMQAEIDASVKAHKILHELKLEAERHLV